MAPKKRLRMRGVKQTPKRLEEEILERSRLLANSPGLLRPMCAGNCRKCLFDKPFKDIDSIARYKDDPDALLKLAAKGSNDLAKAYAGTISLGAAGKIPMLATAIIAGEKVPYAVRGSVGNDKLIGCQHYNDSRLRLLYYNAFVKANKLHLYSFEDGLVCSNYPNMPEDYLYAAFWETPYEFKDDEIMCGHDDVLKLVIRVKSTGDCIEICENCAKEVSTIRYLIARICAIDPADDLEVCVVHAFHTADKDDEEKIDAGLYKKYLTGELNDKTLIMSLKRSRIGDLKACSTSTYIIGNVNYKSDLDAFIGRISGPEDELRTIKGFLEGRCISVIAKTGRSSEVLAEIWDDHWKDVIAVHTSQRIADRYVEKPRQMPSIALADAYRMHISADVVDNLPKFNRPGPMTSTADSLAKAAKVNGKEMVIETFGKVAMKDTKVRALCAAFLLAFDKDAKVPFNITKDELEFAAFLVQFAKNVIDAEGDRYRDAMNTLLTACSSGESV